MAAQQTLIRALALIKAITGGSDDLIASVDSELRFTFYNDAYQRDFKSLWNTEIMLGADLNELLAPWPAERARATGLWQRALTGESFSDILESGPSGEERRVYEIRWQPLRDEQGGVLGAIQILRDITQRFRLEQSLRMADQRKDEFLATLAHELRNPLGALSSGLELLRRSPSSADKRERIMAMMDRQTRHFVRLLEDLFDVSRITRGQIDLRRERCELSEVIQNAVEMSRPQLADRRLGIHLPDHAVHLDADVVRLAQVFSNLLNNAAKFTAHDGRIEIKTQLHDGAVTVTIKDDGVGIAAADLNRIFDRFVQIGSPEGMARSGLGIGLTLVKQLVELHQGTVGASSRGAGCGSEFAVTLRVCS